MHSLSLVTTIAAAFSTALLLGLLTRRLGLSPIVGYLLAGVLIGPHSPGFVGDVQLAQQLAEIGVILLMFGVGLELHLKQLLAVKAIAVPGAIVQCMAVTILSTAVFLGFGLPMMTSAVIGVALAVSSTVVLIRVLMDSDMLQSPQGHVAVGWMLVQDLFIVIVLVLIPMVGGGGRHGSESTAVGVRGPAPLWSALALALFKLVALVAIVMLAVSRIVPRVMIHVAKLRSRELFTLSILVFSIAIAVGSYVFFGASVALGAFLAGLVVAQSQVSHQAAADVLPMRDAFAVLFFVSVGMLFDPAFVVRQPLMVAAAMGIILLAKPLVAILIVAILGHSAGTALTVGLGIAQIGEFSFVLAGLAREHGFMSEAGHNTLVASAIISITLNPTLFRSLPAVESWIRNHRALWRLLNERAERSAVTARVAGLTQVGNPETTGERLAIVAGYGPVGRSVHRLLKDAGLETLVIDLSLETVLSLQREGQPAIYGDASHESILEKAGIRRASHFLLTLPHSLDRASIVRLVRSLNPEARILVRARYLRERDELERAGATAAVFEEAEAAIGLARVVLRESGMHRQAAERKIGDLQLQLIMENVSNIRTQRVRSVMVPWARVRRLPTKADRSEVLAQAAQERFSRWPVIDTQTGRAIGYLLTKDLIAHATDTDWLRLVRPLEAVGPEDSIESTLTRMQGEGATVYVVEDGGKPVGLITREDILEQVVGRIEDEYPHEPEVSLRRAVASGGIVLELSARGRDQAIRELVAAIPSRRLPGGVTQVDLVSLVLMREEELSTDLGDGVAVPHARCPGLGAPLVVFGRSLEGIAFSSQAQEPVHLLFLLVTPAEQPELQITLLGQLARMVREGATRDDLLRAASPAEILEILPDKKRTAK